MNLFSTNDLADDKLLTDFIKNIDGFVVDDTDKVKAIIKMMPSELSYNLKKILVDANIQNVQKQMTQLYDQYLSGQNNFIYDELLPKLQLLKEIQKYINAYGMMEYYNTDPNLYNKLSELLDQTRSGLQKLSENRINLMNEVSQIIPQHVLFGGYKSNKKLKNKKSKKNKSKKY